MKEVSKRERRTGKVSRREGEAKKGSFREEGGREGKEKSSGGNKGEGKSVEGRGAWRGKLVGGQGVGGKPLNIFARYCKGLSCGNWLLHPRLKPFHLKQCLPYQSKCQIVLYSDIPQHCVVCSMSHVLLSSGRYCSCSPGTL